MKILGRLLVSVRSPEEARIAVSAEVDVIDIKEPQWGSLGFAGAEMVEAIAATMQGRNQPHPPLSVALGELSDWSSVSIIPRLPENITFAKMGLSGFREPSDWRERWIRLRRQFDDAASRPLNWIAVHYVDREAGGPRLSEILAAAGETGCAGLLLDTFEKQAGRLFDFLSDEALRDCRDAARRAGILFAVAGRLGFDDVPRLGRLGPDIVAVRGAVCRGGDRCGKIDTKLVKKFGMSIRSDAPRLRTEGSFASAK